MIHINDSTDWEIEFDKFKKKEFNKELARELEEKIYEIDSNAKMYYEHEYTTDLWGTYEDDEIKEKYNVFVKVYFKSHMEFKMIFCIENDEITTIDVEVD